MKCVIRMIVDSILPRAEFESNDHREDTPRLYTILVQRLPGPHFTHPYSNLIQLKRNLCPSH